MSPSASLDPVSIITLRRFALRAAILLVVCVASQHSLVKLADLAGAFAVVCAIIATIKWEQVLGPQLNNWDEALFFLLIFHGAQLAQRLGTIS